MEAEAQHLDLVACPSCGGAGGGPFGRAGSAWDDDEYVCPRCMGVGAIALDDAFSASPPSVPSQRPGLVRAVPDVVAPPTEKQRKASA